MIRIIPIIAISLMVRDMVCSVISGIILFFTRLTVCSRLSSTSIRTVPSDNPNSLSQFPHIESSLSAKTLRYIGMFLRKEIICFIKLFINSDNPTTIREIKIISDIDPPSILGNFNFRYKNSVTGLTAHAKKYEIIKGKTRGKIYLNPIYTAIVVIIVTRSNFLR